MERRPRQWDPLSPFLFLIVVEVLQTSILEACNKGAFKGISVANGGANLSLLQYANDALFFGEWSRFNAMTVIVILKCFENALGLKINLSKSKIYEVGVQIDEVGVVASYLGYDHGSIPFIYLGLPVGKRMRVSDGWLECGGQ
ncbi:arginine repressor C-terminal-like domain-containing protein [Tanacetum coccineum]